LSDTVASNILKDLLTYGSPVIERAIQIEFFGSFYDSVESHPGHHFGMSKVSSRPTELPHAAIGFMPDLFEIVEQRRLQIYRSLRCLISFGGLGDHIYDFSKNVELEIIGGSIPY